MPNRREFVKQATATSAIVASSLQVAVARDNDDATRPHVGGDAAASGPRIKSAIRREETTLRLGGMGDNFHMSWAGDDRQYVAVCDGFGWIGQPSVVHNSRLFTIEGGPKSAVFEEVAGYPELSTVLDTENRTRYYGFGTLALDGYVYQFLSTPNHPFRRDDFTPWPDARFVGAKLIYSADNGRTWCNQDGSTPVVWERWDQRARRNMVFFEEQHGAFALLSVLQMGRNYSQNRDGFVYVYSPNGSIDGRMNQLVMFRVPKMQIRNRNAYEYFAGRKRRNAAWTKDIDSRAVAHTFPSGWVNTALHPWAWMPSVTYNEPLGVYMMASWGMGTGADGRWFAKPSYLGLWISENPWGPWRQIHEEVAWTPQDDGRARAFAPQISPKWVSKDGKSFWLVWADFQSTATQADTEQLKDARKNLSGSDDTVRYFQQLARTMPYYGFNTQRVDLVVA